MVDAHDSRDDMEWPKWVGCFEAMQSGWKLVRFCVVWVGERVLRQLANQRVGAVVAAGRADMREGILT
jgi:hypothetical protein